MPVSNTRFQKKNLLHQIAEQRDAEAKARMKINNDKNLRAQASKFKIGDLVLLKWKRSSKSDTLFDLKPFKVVQVKGSMISVERDGNMLVRNSSFMKLLFGESEGLVVNKPVF